MTSAWRFRALKSALLATVLSVTFVSVSESATSASYDIVIRHGAVYDGFGGKPYIGDVAVQGDRIVYVGPHAPGRGQKEIDAAGKAVAPGFINMLSWATDTLLVDGHAESDIRQGVTLEIFGEGWSMGPWTDEMKALDVNRQGDLKYPVKWTTLGEYLEHLEKKGVSPNIASFVGASTVRIHELGEKDVDPTAEQLVRMRALVGKAMEEGALGVGSSLIYVPASFSETSELAALAEESGRCGGIYITHMRSEATRIFEALDETIEIARQSGAPAEIYHLKLAGKDNWSKRDELIRRIEAARAQGIRLTADMYTYPASATGLDAAMPAWVQEGGVEAWVERLKDPVIRARVMQEMRSPKTDWENYGRMTGADGMLLAGFKRDELKPLIGKTLAEVARMWGVSPEEAAMDLVVKDGSRVEVVYFSMSEDNVRQQLALPWVSLGSDAGAPATKGVFLKSSTHPRAYGNVARLFAKYVRDEKVLSIEEAVRRLTVLPAGNLNLRDRGALKAGHFADIVVFDPQKIQDHATFEKPHQYSTGVDEVLINGVVVLADGEPTGATPGRVVRGRAWTGWPDGGCKASAREWSWTK